LQTLVPVDDPRVELGLHALVEQVQSGRIRRLALEKVDGESALSSPLGPALVALGFQQGPRRLTLSA
jgi:ATP-dependent Lhr-like helicase